MPAVTANGIQIEYEDRGDAQAPVVLLIMGLGGQLTLWPVELVDALVARGFRVIRYDNRDIGLSTKFVASGVPNIRAMVLKSLFGFKPRSPYTLADMANDAVGLLDALGIGKAHIVGASMGGMIAQHVGFSHPARVLSLTSIMSSTGNRRLPRAKPEAMKVLINRPKSADRASMIEFGVMAARVVGSPGYPAEESRLRDNVARNFDRSFSPTGFSRQMAAIIADGDRRKRLAGVSAPTLVIHGTDDPLVPPAAAHDTVAHIAGAEMKLIPGMGHDLPLGLVETIADGIAGNAARAG
jgi:pimeloyl-ACP methyl ester carboxylesterase